MLSLLEVVLTFVGVMLILALIAERLQELVKASLALKSGTRLAAIRRLVIESARSKGLMPIDGQQIFEDLIERLRNLGQGGLRKSAVRLDSIDREQLSGLIKLVNSANVSGISGGKDEAAKTKLAEIGQQAEDWFDLAMRPVNDRHGRRMQIWSLAMALLVVGALNADAFAILKQARNDPEFRRVVAEQQARLQVADSEAKLVNDSLAAVPDTVKPDSARMKLLARRDSLVAGRDSLLFAAAQSPTLFAGYPHGWEFSWAWLFGILFSAVLVSLGAPFWHDLLESLVGMKNRIRLQAAGGGSPAPGSTVVFDNGTTPRG